MEIKARLSRIISEEMREREQQETLSSYNVNVRINYLATTDLFKVQKFINHIRLGLDLIHGRIYFSLLMAIASRDGRQSKKICSST